MPLFGIIYNVPVTYIFTLSSSHFATGNPQFDGMCSKCYKDALKRKQATNPPTPAPIQESAGRNSPLSAAISAAAAAGGYLTPSLGERVSTYIHCSYSPLAIIYGTGTAVTLIAATFGVFSY